MKTIHIPQNVSIEELARFWDEQCLTDFEDELEEVTMPVFAREQKAICRLRLAQNQDNRELGAQLPPIEIGC